MHHRIDAKVCRRIWERIKYPVLLIIYQHICMLLVFCFDRKILVFHILHVTSLFVLLRVCSFSHSMSHSLQVAGFIAETRKYLMNIPHETRLIDHPDLAVPLARSAALFSSKRCTISIT